MVKFFHIHELEIFFLHFGNDSNKPKLIDNFHLFMGSCLDYKTNF